MSYENAEPKILKTLNSNGQVLNDSGEVMENTSDYWKKLYDQAEPKPDKILLSDGTIKDSAGNLIQDTTEYNLKKYNQAEPIPAKYLHSDGTIDENSSSGGGADLDNNVAKTIDVSTYTEPVEITPTAGKDGMKKATVTLSNIPEYYIFNLSGSNGSAILPVSTFAEITIGMVGLFANPETETLEPGYIKTIEQEEGHTVARMTVIDTEYTTMPINEDSTITPLSSCFN